MDPRRKLPNPCLAMALAEKRQGKKTQVSAKCGATNTPSNVVLCSNAQGVY